MSKSSSATTKVASQSGAKSAMPASTTGGAVAATPVVTCDKIAQRAYEKWINRGCTHGNDTQDWHDAEMELKAEMMSKPSGKSQTRR